jgi:maltooligosyltrehalose trehalohydrolase
MEPETDDILGATPLRSGECHFLVWAPFVETVKLHLLAPFQRSIPMIPLPRGYFRSVVDVAAGCRYVYDLGGQHPKTRPDPASRFQPKGVHGSSEVPGLQDFERSDIDWHGLPLRELVFYEIHVGTFTPEGTFDAIIPRLRSLKQLGISAVALMPVAQFPGDRNWGYDGVFPFSVHNSYGGPSGLRRLVNACHREGLCIALDVVYNHLGPEGNYLADFGPYFTDRYRTPWGQAINFDGEQSDEVRRYFIENALYWIRDFHVDILRLDAVHAIVDTSAHPFLTELNCAVRKAAAELDREVHLVAECDRNDIRTVQSWSRGGYGFAAQWNDDFHHAVHAVLTGEAGGYYQDFGQISQITKSLSSGYVYQGEYSKYRLRSHGSASNGASGDHFVVFTQNHDQIGNRMNGERLGHLADFEAVKVAAGVMLLSPFIPLLFMGEEYAETSPFQYFVSHEDPALIEAVRQGRRNEFKAFRWNADAPDPQDPETFQRSKLHWDLQNCEPHRRLRDFYTEMLRLRKQFAALGTADTARVHATPFEEERVLLFHRSDATDELLAVVNFRRAPAELRFALGNAEWKKLLNSRDPLWGGPGSVLPDVLSGDQPQHLEIEPLSLALYHSNRRGMT